MQQKLTAGAQLCLTLLWPHEPCQIPLSMGFSRQESWSRVPLASPGDHPKAGIESVSLESPALEGRSFTTNS